MDRKSIVICLALLLVSVIGLQISTDQTFTRKNQSAKRIDVETDLRSEQVQQSKQPGLLQPNSGNMVKSTAIENNRFLSNRAYRAVDPSLVRTPYSNQSRARKTIRGKSSRAVKTRYISKRNSRV